MTTSPIISGHRASRAVTEMEPVDPRPAALLDTVWPLVQDAGLDEDTLAGRFNDLSAAVLTHYGYQVTRHGRPRIDPLLTAAVRMTRIPEAFGCRHCGVDPESHGARFTPAAGNHQWVEAGDEQKGLRLAALSLELELEALR